MERIPESEAIAAMADARRCSQVMGRRLVQHEYCQLAREVARLLQGTGCQVVGLDLSAAMLVAAAENGAQHRLVANVEAIDVRGGGENG